MVQADRSIRKATPLTATPINPPPSRLASWVRRITPTREKLETVPILRPLAQRPALWRATRRSVPRAVAIGFFISIVAVIPGVHMIAAALMCVPLRANIPVAVGATFISNPATLPLIVAAALVTGNYFGFHADMATLHALSHDGASWRQWAHWLASDAAPALLTGLIVIAVATAALGYAVTAFVWRLRVARKRRTRLHARAERRAAEPRAGDPSSGSAE